MKKRIRLTEAQLDMVIEKKLISGINEQRTYQYTGKDKLTPAEQKYVDAQIKKMNDEMTQKKADRRQPGVQPKTEPVVQPKTEPVVQPKTEPVVQPKTEPVVDPKPEPEVQPQRSTPLEFSKVVDVPGASKDELYNRAKMWFSTAFNSAKDIIQLDDKNQGVIVGKAMMGSGLSKEGRTRYTIKITIKDGKYKYDISDFIHSSGSAGYYKGASTAEWDFGLLTTSDVPTAKKPFGTTKKWFGRMWDYTINNAKQLGASLGSSIESSMSGTGQKQETWEGATNMAQGFVNESISQKERVRKNKQDRLDRKFGRV